MDVPILLTACLLLTFLANVVQCCDPAEIGKRYIINSTANVQTGVRVVWQTSKGITLFKSDDQLPNKYANYVGSRTQLTILNVTKIEGAQYLHLVNYVVVFKCILPVYKRANNPACENVTAIGNQIRTRCTTAEVYPQSKCQFILQNGGTTDRRVIADGTSYITYSHNYPHSERNEYYSTTCTLQYPVDGLKPGTWTLQVIMFPDLTGVSLAQGTTGQVANSLTLSVPTVNIDPNNCPKGLGEGDTNVRNSYIRQGEQARCMCTRAHAGNPPGTISWSSSQDGKFDILPSVIADEATIKINSPGTFTCRSTSVLNGSHSVTYTPTYAYGPSSASLTFRRPGPIYLCQNQQTNIEISCQVPANSFNPSIKFTIREDTSIYLVTKVDGDTAQSKSVNYNFTRSGPHTFTCKVENAVFSDIVSEAPARAIQVYVPPNRSPFLDVKGQYVNTENSETWVKQGSDIIVSCSAGQAYPLVNSVTVNCGQDTSSSGQLSVLGVNGEKLVCGCAVDHVTNISCNGLNLNTRMTIQIAHGPDEVAISFADDQLREVPNEPFKLCMAESPYLTVICAVKPSDVRPGLTNTSLVLIKPNTISNQRMYTDLSGGNYRLVNKLKVTTGGTHKLTCEARNPKFTDIKETQTKILEVREPPNNPPKMSANSNLNGDILVEGDNVTVTCSVSGGYPSVQSVTLTCGQDQSVTSNGMSAELTLNEIGLTYNETNCTCQATHVTGCYDLKSVLQLTVLMSNQTLSEQKDSPPIGAAVGGAIGAFVVIAVVVGGIYFLRRRMKKKERPCPEEGGYDPHQDPEAVIIDNELYATARQEQHVPVSAKDYTTIKPTMESATALPKKYNPENVDNPYEDVNPVKMDRKSLFKKSQTKPTHGAKPKIPKTSVKTDAVPKPGEQAQNNTDSEYATVAKTKPSHSKSSVHDETGDLTTVGATGGMPVVPVRLYDKDELKVSVNQQSASKGKQKKTKDKSAKKEKTKDKKKKNEKEKDSENDHIYSNETFDRSGDADVYANIAMGMKSTNDVDDGMHKNKDGLVYTTIVGVGSLKGAQRPVHHPRKEASVDYADIDFNKIVANREDQD